MNTNTYSRISLVFTDYATLLTSDPQRCRAMLEALLLDSAALRAYERVLKVESAKAADPKSPALWLDERLIRQILIEGLRNVPDNILRRLIADGDALFTLQVRAQMLDESTSYWTLSNDQETAVDEETTTLTFDQTPKNIGSKIILCGEGTASESTDPVQSSWYIQAATTSGWPCVEWSQGSYDAALGDEDDLWAQRPIVASATIQRRVCELADQIGLTYNGQPLMVVPVLTGGCFFALDLYRSLCQKHRNLRFEPVVAQSYDGTQSKRVIVDQEMLNRASFEGYHVLIVDDILDTGKTLTELVRVIAKRGPLSTRTCVLLLKLRDSNRDQTRFKAIMPDYVGFLIPDYFVVGYGLDYNGRYRELPNIHVLPHSVLHAPGRDKEGIVISLRGKRDHRPTALHLSGVKLINRSTSPIERATFKVEFCARRGWSDEPEGGNFVNEIVQEFTPADVWDLGDVLQADIHRPNFDETLDHVRITFQGRIDGQQRQTVNTVSREMIVNRCSPAQSRDMFHCDVIWPLGVTF